MSKRKIGLVALSLCLVAILAVGGTLAYLTSTSGATNTFTVGNVKIALHEQERDGNGGLKDFTQGKKLYPIIGSAQGEKDSLGLPTAKNYVDKVVTVENTGSEDAYIRAYFAIPSALDDGYETFNAGLNVLHYNFGTENGKNTEGNQWQWKKDGKWKYYETVIDGIRYNVYMADYATTVAPGATTVRLLDGVYLDKSFDIQNGTCYAFNNALALDAGWDWNNVKCPVMAVAVQAAGFDSAEEAVTEAFGEQYNPWKGAVENWQ